MVKSYLIGKEWKVLLAGMALAGSLACQKANPYLEYNIEEQERERLVWLRSSDDIIKNMKKRLPVLLIFIGLLVVFLLILGKQKVGDVRPALLPSKVIRQTSESRQQKVGDSVDFLKVPSGFSIGKFASSIDGARDLEFSEGRTLLVTNPSNGAVVALPDKDNDGKADSAKTVVANLQRPHGIAFFNGKLFIAQETKVSRYNWDETNLSATLDKELFSLPSGGRHFTRTITFNKEGKMFVSLGSTCDVCYENHEWLAAVITSDSEGTNPRLFAKGLRNAVFITLNQTTNEVWGTEMGRDFLGDNLPPDEVNIIKDGKDYGWPNCYGNKIYDSAFNGNLKKGTPCESTQPPVYEIPAHSAPLGLTFIQSEQFPSDWQGDLLIAYHGSWNRSTPTRYKVVRLNVEGNTITDTEDFITGFLQDSLAVARPVDVVFDKDGSLFISDDKAGNIYKVIKK